MDSTSLQWGVAWTEWTLPNSRHYIILHHLLIRLPGSDPVERGRESVVGEHPLDRVDQMDHEGEED